MDSKLENEAYKRVINARLRFTKLVIVSLCLFAGLAYLAINKMLPEDAWWFVPALSICGLLVHMFTGTFHSYADKLSAVICPKCSKQIETQQIIGNPFPKSCVHCGLQIVRI